MNDVIAQFKPSAASLWAVLLLAILLTVFFFALGRFSPMLALDNVRQAAPLGVVVLGQAIVLMMGRVDLSVGATASFANIVLSSVFAGNMDNGARLGGDAWCWRASGAYQRLHGH